MAHEEAPPVEVGGAEVAADYRRTRALVSALGLPLEPMETPAGMANHVRGQLVRSVDWEGSAANLTVGQERALQPAFLEFGLVSQHGVLPDPGAWLRPEFRHLDVPAARWLRERGASEEAIRLINLSSNVQDVASSSALNSIRDVTRYKELIGRSDRARHLFGQGEGSGHIIGGSSRLPEGMAAELTEPVQTGCAVVAMRQISDGRQPHSSVELTCQDGRRFHARHVVSAIPFFALRRVELDPSPAGAFAEAVHDCVYSATTQVHLRVEGAYWEQDEVEPGMYTDSALQRVFGVVCRSGRVERLVVWLNGRGAERFDLVPGPQREGLVLSELARLRPSTRGKLRVVQCHSWGSSPYIGGNRHVYNAGQVTRFGHAVKAPLGRIHFAGEHTRDVEVGMEAALASAERVHREILGEGAGRTHAGS